MDGFVIISHIILMIVEKKGMIDLVHENHDEWPNVTLVQYFCKGFRNVFTNCVSFSNMST